MRGRCFQSYERCLPIFGIGSLEPAATGDEAQQCANHAGQGEIRTRDEEGDKAFAAYKRHIPNADE